ncbi:3-hydroxybutyrate dehydrogenase [Arsukibacterium sp. MJ3]|jgi:3-hydroxybutyrate dehydrogenase|uniref:3-hydroxybutyrate dehydrogenase n=1 Tax=Arsukibacterium sp. MJ3 TaxID=1632859 RepID=UPI00062742E5|nr:3-hydroxybutyrate dehydrogenase [Arsukibacterium sp. MJ3]KKO49612.1 3-hydroxybutyrate dehydrogenase [Arsukibacterium sp. MJ3]
MRAVITGGTGGIGFAIASHFGQAGYQVVLADLNESLLQQKAAALCSQGIIADYCVLDVTNQQAIEACAKRFPADILVNNAGIQHVARLEDFPPEKWALLISVMLTGPAMLTRAMLPHMRSNNFGRIINIGSIHAVIASPFKSAYVAAKHGLLGLSKVVALENADKNITINTICPAYVKTPLVEQQIAAQAKEHNLTEQQVIEQIMLAPMPQKAFIDVSEIAEMAAFLCQDAARHMTAQTLILDGGWTAR